MKGFKEPFGGVENISLKTLNKTLDDFGFEQIHFYIEDEKRKEVEIEYPEDITLGEINEINCDERVKRAAKERKEDDDEEEM